jgi:hypothetical protein
MIMVAALSNALVSVPAEIISQGGAIAIVLLIVSLSFDLLFSNSKYWSTWAQSTFDINTKPLLITFSAIVMFKIISIL